MEWLGALFKGIGDTFTAGANVNKMQSDERIAKLALQDQAQQRYYDQATGRVIGFLQIKEQDAQLVKVLIIGAVATFMLVIFMKLWR